MRFPWRVTRTPSGAAFGTLTLRSVSGGIPRRINNLADLCLFEGWKRRAKAVDTSVVRVAQSSL